MGSEMAGGAEGWHENVAVGTKVCEGRSEWKAGFRKRTKQFASDTIRLYTALPKRREEVGIIGRQLLRAATSVAAQYREASRARSDAEFLSKIEACAQEADETMLWLELLRDDCAIEDGRVETLLKETDEFLAIFTTMAKNVKARMR